MSDETAAVKLARIEEKHDAQVKRADTHERQDVERFRAMESKLDLVVDKLDKQNTWMWKMVVVLAVLGAVSPFFAQAARSALEHVAVAAP